VDAEDEKGNTLLIVACQNCNRRMVEMLLARSANINHQVYLIDKFDLSFIFRTLKGMQLFILQWLMMWMEI